MCNSKKHIVLASASPRRLQLLQQIGLDATVIPADIDERPQPDECAQAYMMRVATDKAQTVFSALDDTSDQVVVAADTSVVVAGQILGKPCDAQDSERMLRALSGVEHSVLSAVVLVSDSAPLVQRLVETRVWMRETTRQERAAYWASGEPEGKAGSYAIQGLGAVLIDRIEGSYTTVVGLPLYELSALLVLHGIDVLSAPRERN